MYSHLELVTKWDMSHIDSDMTGFPRHVTMIEINFATVLLGFPSLIMLNISFFVVVVNKYKIIL